MPNTDNLAKEISAGEPPTRDPHTSRQIVTYVLLVFAFSLVFYWLMIRAHSVGAGDGLYVLGIMWCPGLAAIATLKLNGRQLSELGWGWGKTKYQVLAWFIPLLYTFISYSIVWSAGLGGVPDPEFVGRIASRMGPNMPAWLALLLYVALAGTFELARSMSSALGEEIGWRGFMVPELAKVSSFTVTSLLSGLVWAVWHYPGLLFTDYNGGTPAWYGMSCFTVMVVAISFVFAWMRLKSGSLWTGVILHASHNLYIQEIFTPLTRNTGKTNWYIDEFGAVLPLVAIVFAVYFWRRRSELPVLLAVSSLSGGSKLVGCG
ncbi:MAG TPA: type II CAAX endopeptidase family protein [Terriglobales bacterium]|nr:type II CAAX endopeptidase family protein [Terriglobales bacterium]